MASNILSKVAGDLGGCFDGFQQSYRYDPYSADYNLAVTSNKPTKNKVNDTDFEQNPFVQPIIDATEQDRDLNAPAVTDDFSSGTDDGSTAESVRGELGVFGEDVPDVSTFSDDSAQQRKIDSVTTPAQRRALEEIDRQLANP